MDRINVHGLYMLRCFRSPRSDTPFEFTFIQYVKEVTIELNLSSGKYNHDWSLINHAKRDHWGDNLELITRVRELFPRLWVDERGRNVTLSLQNGSLGVQNLVDMLTHVQHVGHLRFMWVVLEANAAVLKRLLCDESFPSLRKITIEGAGYDSAALWRPNVPWEYDDVGIHTLNSPKSDTLTLDELCLLDNFPQLIIGRFPRRSANLLWLQDWFDDISINKIVIRAPLDDRRIDFWSEVPEMIKRVKDNLVELDICSELEYRDFIRNTRGFYFPKLQILKLQICQGSAYWNSYHNLGDTADGLRALLRQWRTPILNEIVIQIERADDCIVGVEKVDKKVAIFEERLGGIVSPLDWAVLDDAVVELADRSDVYSKSQGFTKPTFRSLIMLKNWNGWKDSRLRTYVQQQLPRCVAHGVDVETKVVPKAYLDDSTSFSTSTFLLP
ncbi:hypothetical protein BJ165DRAFT_1445414 [Panaeolus papilionaceus]|nr:hypothetical protein BJ165DRAFT_1445414 [Panaeolus papilionaceus]